MTVSRRDIERAVVDAYCAATDADRAVVEAGLDGDPAVPFDSILGVELMAAVEGVFKTTIPEAEETVAKNFKTLRDFARMIERYVSSREQARTS